MNDLKNMNSDYLLKRIKVDQSDSQPLTQKSNENSKLSGQSFNEVLHKIKSNENLKFSKHAIQRLNSRNITLSDSEMSRLNSGISKAKSKGVKDALIMMDNKAFVASIANKTIITATVDDQLKDSVFTNIDGAVIV
jgi:flagellar operon protein